MKIISIEGNIGSGKSTCIQYLKQKYKNNTNVYFVDEPIQDWNKIKDKNNKTIFECFYEDKNKYSFQFQLTTLVTRYKKLKETIELIKKKNKQNKLRLQNAIIITERCIFSDHHIFTKMLFDTGFITKMEYSIYMEYYNEFIKISEPIHYIFINTNIQTCLDRINKRFRTEEKSISHDYIQLCHQYYTSFINNEKIKNRKIYTIEGNTNRITNNKYILSEKEQNILNKFIT